MQFYNEAEVHKELDIVQNYLLYKNTEDVSNLAYDGICILELKKRDS